MSTGMLPTHVAEAMRSSIARVRSHGGDVEADYDDETEILTLRLTGVCTACPARPVTFGAAFWGPLKELPGVRDVRLENLRINERTLLRIARSFDDLDVVPLRTAG